MEDKTTTVSLSIPENLKKEIEKQQKIQRRKSFSETVCILIEDGLKLREKNNNG